MAGDDVLTGLIARTAAGDQAAFQSLYQRSSGRLFAVCLRIARERELAEAALTRTYARIFERAREFDPAHCGALAWMIGIARHQAIAVARAEPRDLIRIETALSDIDAPVELAVRRCLGMLEETERRALLLAYREGLSYAELGAVLGVSAEAAKACVSRALVRMRQYLDDER